jgi:hypothetical protein
MRLMGAVMGRTHACRHVCGFEARCFVWSSQQFTKPLLCSIHDPAPQRHGARGALPLGRAARRPGGDRGGGGAGGAGAHHMQVGRRGGAVIECITLLYQCRGWLRTLFCFNTPDAPAPLASLWLSHTSCFLPPPPRHIYYVIQVRPGRRGPARGVPRHRGRTAGGAAGAGGAGAAQPQPGAHCAALRCACCAVPRRVSHGSFAVY